MSNPKNYKVVLLGSSTVGKSSIALRFVRDIFSNRMDSTIGAAYNMINVNDIKIDLWDTAGQERYMSLVNFYTRGVDVAILVYDLNCNDSIDRLEYYLKELMVKVTKDYRVMIVGNKCDIVKDRREAIKTENKVRQMVNKLDFDKPVEYFIVSAKTNEGVSRLKKNMAQLCLDVKVDEGRVDLLNLNDDSSGWVSGYCPCSF